MFPPYPPTTGRRSSIGCCKLVQYIHEFVCIILLLASKYVYYSYDPYYARTHTLRVHNMHSMQGIMVSKILLLASTSWSRVACVPPLYRYVHKIHDMRSIHSNPSSRPWGSPPRRTSSVSAHQPTHQTSIPLRPPNLPTIRAEHPHPPEICPPPTRRSARAAPP